jgi:uncharacterized protein YcnI
MRIAWWRPMLLAAFLVLFAAGVAWAHVEISPEEANAGDSKEFTLKVEQELDSPTTEVRLEIPDGFVVTDVPETPGWQASSEDNAVVWSGGQITPEEDSAEFTFQARAPEETGIYAWKVFQTYKDGEVVEWTGSEGSEEPAPLVEVISGDSQKATSSNTETHEHGEDNKTHAETTTGSGSLPSSGGLDPVFFSAGIVVLVLTTIGLAQLLRR